MAVKYAPCIRQLTCCSDQQEALARKAAELETSHKNGSGGSRRVKGVSRALAYAKQLLYILFFVIECCIVFQIHTKIP